jgi:hypothetical protein
MTQDEDKLNKKHNIIQTVLKAQDEDKQNKKHNIIQISKTQIPPTTE